jgi:hypothetical protein
MRRTRQPSHWQITIVAILSTAPRNNYDYFDFAAGFLSTSSPKTRTANDDPTSIEQIAA